MSSSERRPPPGRRSHFLSSSGNPEARNRQDTGGAIATRQGYAATTAREQHSHHVKREGEAQRTGRIGPMLRVQEFYNGIIGAGRINAPTITEAAQDLRAAYHPVYEA